MSMLVQLKPLLWRRQLYGYQRFVQPVIHPIGTLRFRVRLIAYLHVCSLGIVFEVQCGQLICPSTADG